LLCPFDFTGASPIPAGLRQVREIGTGQRAAGGARLLREGDRHVRQGSDHKWHVEIEFFEDDVHTHASAHARLRDDTLTTTGDAYRNPKDPSAPLVGEEIAAARALIALGTDLLMAASANIEKSTQHPVHLYR